MINNLKSLGLIVIILIAGFVIGWQVGSNNEKVAPNENTGSIEDSINQENNKSASEKEQSQISISIIEEDSGIAKQFSLDYTPGRNLFAYLQRLEARRDITLKYKDYGGGMGIFIEKINDVGDDGSNKWWQYWVNGKYANVGVSGYVPDYGDSIEFKYTGQHPDA